MSPEERELLRRFYNAFPEGPLEPEDPHYWPIYEDRKLTPWDPVEVLARNIEFHDESHLQLLAGSSGCGKSTEMRRLAKRLESGGYRVLFVDLGLPEDDLTGVPPVRILPQEGHFAWILLEILRSLSETAGILNEEEKRQLLNQLQGLAASYNRTSFKRTFTDSSQLFKQISRWWAMTFEREGDLPKHLLQLLIPALNRGVGTAKTVILLDSVHHILQQGNFLLRSDLLSLRRLNAYIVLAVDPLTGSTDLLRPQFHAAPEWIEPIYSDVSSFSQAYDSFKSYLSQRNINQIIPEDSLEKVFDSSGGVLRLLFRLLREIALRADTIPVASVTVENVILELKNEFQELDSDELSIIEGIYQGQSLSDAAWGAIEEESHVGYASRLLSDGTLLYHRNRGCFIHPLVEKALEIQKETFLEFRIRRAAIPEGSFHLERIEAQAIRVFENLSLELKPPEEETKGQWLVLLGDNGVGKTTILRALTLALSERPIAEALLQLLGPSAPFLRGAATEGKIEVRLVDGIYRALLIRDPRGIERLRGHGRVDVDIPLYAYGCQRGTALGGPDRGVDFKPLDDVRSLFDPAAQLIHAETWLTKLRAIAQDDMGGGPRATFFEAVQETLTSVLHGVDDLQFQDDNLWLRGSKVGHAPLAALSDGYLSLAGWVVDLIARWADRARRLGEIPDGNFREKMTGLVLVDEIDLHLHPLWQVDVISDLRKIFPRLSFVATTHNPLTLLGTQEGEIVVLRRDESGQVNHLQKDLEPGIRADQVLTGEWFGLPSTVDAETQEMLKQHRDLLRQGTPRNDPNRREQERQLRHRLGSFADTSIDRMAQSIAAELMPSEPKQLSPEERSNLRQKILARARQKIQDDQDSTDDTSEAS